MMSNLPWQPICEYPQVFQGEKGQTVLLCQADTGSWGTGYIYWPQYLSQPFAVMNGYRIRRPTHFLPITVPAGHPDVRKPGSTADRPWRRPGYTKLSGAG